MSGSDSRESTGNASSIGAPPFVFGAGGTTPAPPPAAASGSGQLPRSTYKAKLEILGEVSFQDWKMSLFYYLDEACVLGCLEEGKFAAESREEMRAFKILMDSLSMEHRMLCRNAGSTAKGYKTLWNKYHGGDETHILRVKDELENIQKKKGESPEVYLARAQGLADSLEMAGRKVFPSELVTFIVNGLPEEYRDHKISLEVAGATQGLEPLGRALAILDRKFGSAQKASAVVAELARMDVGMAAGVRGSVQGRSGGGPSVPQMVQDYETRTGNRDADKVCHRCHQLGHIRRNCRVILSGPQDRAQPQGANMGYAVPTQPPQPTGNQGRGPPVHPLANHLHALGEDGNRRWIADSGASSSFCGDLKILSNFVPYSAPQPLGTALEGVNGMIVGEGDIAFMDGDLDIFWLKGVKYVPGIALNLVSVSHAVDQDFAFEATAEGEYVGLKWDDMHKCKVTREGGLYFVHLSAVDAQDVDDWDSPCEGQGHAFAAQVEGDLDLWHRRLGHVGVTNLQRLMVERMLKGCDIPLGMFKEKRSPCETCIRGKQVRATHKPSESNTQRPLELLHTDVAYMQEEDLHGNKYVLVVIDDFTRFVEVVPMKTKGQASSEVIKVISRWETQREVKVQKLRSDNGGEYCNRELEEFCEKKGIAHQLTPPYSPESNGVAERFNRTLQEKIRCMLDDAGLPDEFWGEAGVTAAFLRNLSPVAKRTATPWELFTGMQPNVQGLRVFGCKVFVKMEKFQVRKIGPQSVAGIFLGYQPNSSGYRVMVDGRITVSKDVVFLEDKKGYTPDLVVGPENVSKEVVEEDCEATDDDEAWVQRVAGPAVDASVSQPAAVSEAFENVLDEGVQESDGVASDTSNNGSSCAGEAVHDGGENSVLESGEGRRHEYNTRGRVYPPGFYAQAAFEMDEDLAVPTTFAQAQELPQRNQWLQSMQEEMDSLDSRHTYDIVPRPIGVKVLPVRWVYVLKKDEDGNIVRFKARVVVKGYMQQEGLDYDETYAPVCRQETRRALIAISAQEGMHLEHLDVKTAFLYGELEEEVYTEPPPGFTSGGKVWKLRKALYGLKQAPRAWHTKLVEVLTSMGFKATGADPGLFVHKTKLGQHVILLTYVDDMLLASHDVEAIKDVKCKLKAAFDIHELGEVTHFLGNKVTRDWEAGTIKLSNPSKVEEMLQSFGMADSKPSIIPMAQSFVMTEQVVDESGGSGSLLGEGHRYLELIGSLMYLANTVRPDIAHAVGVLARYRTAPTTAHWEAALKVLSYLGTTKDLGLVYGNSGGGLHGYVDRVGKAGLHGYVDADFAGCLDTRKSTTGFVFMLYGAAISWCSRKQQSTASSTVESEYLAFHSAAKEAVWLRLLLRELGQGNKPVLIFGDNQGCIANVKNPIASKYTKHIDVAYHAVRELATTRQIIPWYVPSHENVADTFTKPLASVKFRKFRGGMGLC
jgi:transposase InsO family protein